MRNFRHLASAASLLVAVGAATAGSAEPRPVYLICGAEAAPVCQALASVLGKTVKDRDVAVLDEGAALPEAHHLALRFVETGRSDSMLSGRLEWTRPDGSSGAGPEIEVSVMDDALSERMLEDYAVTLLQNSNLPL